MFLDFSGEVCVYRNFAELEHNGFLLPHPSQILSRTLSFISRAINGLGGVPGGAHFVGMRCALSIAKDVEGDSSPKAPLGQSFSYCSGSVPSAFSGNPTKCKLFLRKLFSMSSAFCWACIRSRCSCCTLSGRGMQASSRSPIRCSAALALFLIILHVMSDNRQVHLYFLHFRTDQRRTSLVARISASRSDSVGSADSGCVTWLSVLGEGGHDVVAPSCAAFHSRAYFSS